MRWRIATLLLLIATAFGCERQEEASAPEVPIPVTSSLTETHEICEVLAKPSGFLGKTIRLKASIAGFHQPSLFGAGCCGNQYVLAENIDFEMRSRIFDAVRKRYGDLSRSEMSGDIVVLGRLERYTGGPNPEMPVVPEYRFVVSSVEEYSPNLERAGQCWYQRGQILKTKEMRLQ